MILCKDCNKSYSNKSNWKRHKTMGQCFEVYNTVNNYESTTVTINNSTDKYAKNGSTSKKIMMIIKKNSLSTQN